MGIDGGELASGGGCSAARQWHHLLSVAVASDSADRVMCSGWPSAAAAAVVVGIGAGDCGDGGQRVGCTAGGGGARGGQMVFGCVAVGGDD